MNRNLLEEIRALNLPIMYQLPLYEVLEREKRTTAVLKAFQFADPRYFNTRLRLLSEKEGNASSIWIDYIWIVTISAWWAGGMVIAAGTKFLTFLDRKNVMQGVLLIPNEAHNYDLFIGKEPFRAVELPSSSDQVADSILNLNLFESENNILPGNVISPHISIMIFNGNGKRSINYGGGELRDTTWINLFASLNQMIDKLRELYADPEIDGFFSKGLRRGGNE